MALKISYMGTDFDGWQSQSSGRGIADALYRSLASLGESGRLIGAGRTDRGVHAREQVAHIDLVRDWQPQRLPLAINARLPQSVRVLSARPVPQDFDARRSATGRSYRYFIWNGAICYPHLRPTVTELHGNCDWRRAQVAAKLLIGTHDFSAFCRSADRPAYTVRTIKEISLRQHGSLVQLRITADGFLTNMVRIIMSGLIEISRGRRDETWLKRALQPGSERLDAVLPQPSGLFLWRISYPPVYDL